jgi:hypothetical protein
MSLELIVAQVIDDDDAGAYNQTDGGIFEDSDRRPGEVRIEYKVGNTTRRDLAAPLLPNITSVPLNGELVIALATTDGRTDTKSSNNSRYYYLTTINVHDLKNSNLMPWISRPGLDIFSKTASEPDQYGFKEKDVPNLQPYEGDIIYQDRFGSALRFTSGIGQNVRSKTGNKVYEIDPSWTGPEGEPLTILTTGINPSNQYYTVEDPNKDKSSIYLTTGHKIKLQPSQRRLAPGIRSVDGYTKPQVIITSDRLIFNSRTDEIVLSSKSTVGVATKDWAMDMNAFFDLFDEVLDELLAMGPSGANQFVTGVGPTVGNPALVAKVSTIKAKLGRMRQ